MALRRNEIGKVILGDTRSAKMPMSGLNKIVTAAEHSIRCAYAIDTSLSLLKMLLTPTKLVR